MEPLVAVVVLEAEVGDELKAALSSAVSEREVLVVSRTAGPGVGFVGPAMSDLRLAMQLVSWVIDAAVCRGLDDALVVEASVVPVSSLLGRSGRLDLRGRQLGDA